MVGKGELSECDRGTRRAVKRWLHLHPSTADGLLYTKPMGGPWSDQNGCAHPTSSKTISTAVLSDKMTKKLLKLVDDGQKKNGVLSQKL